MKGRIRYRLVEFPDGMDGIEFEIATEIEEKLQEMRQNLMSIGTLASGLPKLGLGVLTGGSGNDNERAAPALTRDQERALVGLLQSTPLGHLLNNRGSGDGEDPPDPDDVDPDGG